MDRLNGWVALITAVKPGFQCGGQWEGNKSAAHLYPQREIPLDAGQIDRMDKIG